MQQLFRTEIEQDPTVTAAGEYLADEKAGTNYPVGPIPKTFFGMSLGDGPMGLKRTEKRIEVRLELAHPSMLFADMNEEELMSE